MQKKLKIESIKSISGVVNLPGSKSISNRAILLSAVSNGTTILKNILNSDDVNHMLLALKEIGIFYKLYDNNYTCVIKGQKNCFFNKKEKKLFLGNAGTAMRPLLSMLSLGKNNIILTGNSRMQERPIGHLVDALRQGGSDIHYLKNEYYPPVHIKGGFIGGEIKINGSISSQFLSSIIMAAPIAKNDTVITVKGDLVSKPYIKMTIKLMEVFGITLKVSNNYKNFYIVGNQSYISPEEYYIESDLSSATYFLAAAAIKGGSVEIKGIRKNSIQGDLYFINILEKMGVLINWKSNSIICTRSKLIGLEIDCNDIPDAAMTLAMLGLFTKKEMFIKNIYNWRVKETDRISAMSNELKKIGASVKEGYDYIIVSSPKNFISSTLNTYDDHRIAMCFSLIALSGVAVTILNPDCVKKTFPEYFKIFFSICH